MMVHIAKPWVGPLPPPINPGPTSGPDLLETIRRIAERCQGGFSIEWNQHRSSYWRPSEEIEARKYDVPLVWQGEMDATDTMVVAQGYPDTPGSFYVVTAPDLTRAIDGLWKALDL